MRHAVLFVALAFVGCATLEEQPPPDPFASASCADIRVAIERWRRDYAAIPADMRNWSESGTMLRRLIDMGITELVSRGCSVE